MALTIILIYLIGYIFAFMQHRKNDLLLNDEKRTNREMMWSLAYSLFSWVWFLFCLGIYLYEAKLPKFKYWLKQESKL